MIDSESYTRDKKFLVYKTDNYYIRLKTVGKDSIRVIASRKEELDLPSYWPSPSSESYEDFKKIKTNEKISLINGKLRVDFDGRKLVFYNRDEVILEEVSLRQSNVRRTVGIDDHVKIPNFPSSSLAIDPYEFTDISGDIVRSRLRFIGDADEKIYGMGGYQEESLNKNNKYIELMQRNSQTVIPAYISNKNYGFIWNNPSVGSAFFGSNEKVWEASDSEIIDYIVFVGDTPKELIVKLTSILGKPPQMDTDLLGLWQSKLRYQTTKELEEVYDQYLEREITPSVMVIDYFHWTREGDYKFDLEYWKGINKLSKKMEKHGTKLMVSVWPTIEEGSENYRYLKKNHLLIDGINTSGKIFNSRYMIDLLKEESRQFLAKKLRENYISKGVKLFWADQAEPEMDIYNHFSYKSGGVRMSKLANLYPYFYAEAINRVSNDLPVLIRSSFLSSQRYSSLLWSGDIESSFTSMRRQIQFAVSVGVCGQSWWTSDIGGFHSGDSQSDYFKELLIRWYQFSVFSPILRMHGDRQPHYPKIGNKGGGLRTSGSSNEIFSFGKEVEQILTSYTKIRMGLQNYISDLFLQASKKGFPLIRPIFFEYPEDDYSYSEGTQYFFGSDMIICPVTEYKQRKIDVYIPDSNWIDVYKGTYIKKGLNKVDCPLYKIPVYVKKDSKYYDKFIEEFKIIGDIK